MISPLALRLVFVVAVSMLPGSGAASAGVPIDRTILPIPPRPYVNQIGTSYRDSTSQIQPTLSAPPGAPNIVLILLDDAGYGQTSTFGAPIPTPNA